jgi:transcriptional regulator with PAS, ATPase and Fis domain
MEASGLICFGGRGKQKPLEEVIHQALVAQTPSLAPLTKTLALAAMHEVTVLLTGETGTGKSFLARLIHDHSPRRDQHFLTVPCGALSNSLLESELFGHLKGSFTGADRDKPGKFAAAGRGTLLLDEIDTLSFEQQAKLLRVIETGEFEPVGSNDTQLCHARIIAASNVNLDREVELGRFRQDLFYRLNVISVHLPPLRERVEDIAPLALSLVARFGHKFGKEVCRVSPGALAHLEKFPWPGNIRQLENTVQCAVIASPGPELSEAHLPLPVKAAVAPVFLAPRTGNGSLQDNCQAGERELIKEALTKHRRSRSRAAAALGVSRVTLYKKIKKYGLENWGTFVSSTT